MGVRTIPRVLAWCALLGSGYLCAYVFMAYAHVSVSAAPPAALLLDSTSALVAGPADAAVVVRIFGDYQCPGCQALDRTLGDTLLSLARSGRVRVVYIQRPLAGNRAGEELAHAVACVARERAWDVHRSFYRARSAGVAPTLRAFRPFRDTSAIGMHDRCLESDAVRRRVRSALRAASAAGFREVPVVLVGGQRVRYRTHAALLRYVHRSLE
jgi:protein-disulfide isomerase